MLLNKLNENYSCHLGKNIGNHRETEIFNNYGFKGINIYIYLIFVCPFIAGVSFGEWWTPGAAAFPQKLFNS